MSTSLCGLNRSEQFVPRSQSVQMVQISLETLCSMEGKTGLLSVWFVPSNGMFSPGDAVLDNF